MSLAARAAELIRALGLQPHPEGGHYREVFRSGHLVRPGDGRGDRAALTTIYFLLAAGEVSRWHRVESDEVWHLYEGGPLDLFEIDLEHDSCERHRLDNDHRVHTVHAGRWQAARPTGDYALMGCTVGPGFDFADFRLLSGDRESASRVRAQWPDLGALI